MPDVDPSVQKLFDDFIALPLRDKFVLVIQLLDLRPELAAKMAHAAAKEAHEKAGLPW